MTERGDHWTLWLENKSSQEIGEKIAEFEALAERDPLTSLLNIRGWNNLLRTYTSLADREGETLAFLVLDVDDFKNINDTFGHKAGDLTLKFIANILRENGRQSDMEARIGGDEFAVMLPFADQNDAEIVKQRLTNLLQEMINDELLRKMNLSVSIGVGIRQPYGSVEQAINDADENMYHIKRNR